MKLAWLRKRSAWQRVLALAVLGHIALGALRLPHAAWGKRLEQMQELERRGAIEFHLESYGRETVEAVRQLSLLPEDCVILWRGEHRGPVEFAPALLRPRLIYALDSVPLGATQVLGRPVAQRTTAGRSHDVVLVAERRTLRLEER